MFDRYIKYSEKFVSCLSIYCNLGIPYKQQAYKEEYISEANL